MIKNTPKQESVKKYLQEFYLDFSGTIDFTVANPDFTTAQWERLCRGYEGITESLDTETEEINDICDRSTQTEITGRTASYSGDGRLYIASNTSAENTTAQKLYDLNFRQRAVGNDIVIPMMIVERWNPTDAEKTKCTARIQRINAILSDVEISDGNSISFSFEWTTVGEQTLGSFNLVEDTFAVDGTVVVEPLKVAVSSKKASISE